jgi:hypothetical protein
MPPRVSPLSNERSDHKKIDPHGEEGNQEEASKNVPGS